MSEMDVRVSQWPGHFQLLFLRKILEQIPTAIRSVWSDDTQTPAEQLAGIKWLNEFNHRIWNLYWDWEQQEQEQYELLFLWDQVKFHAAQHPITKAELAPLLNSAFQRCLWQQNQ